MATITLLFSNKTLEQKTTYELVEEDFDDFLESYRRTYGQVADDPERPDEKRDRTDEEVLRCISDGFMAGTLDFVRREMQEQAVVVARDAVSRKEVASTVSDIKMKSTPVGGLGEKLP